MGHFETEQYGKGGAGLHALIIGVGEYPNGTKHGAPSLTSPPKSAAAMARWLLDSYHLPCAKLHTLDVLISGEEFSHRGVTSRDAGIEQIANAIREWKRRGDSHPENQLLFYFCGHGVTGPAANHVVLCASDFGAIEDNPYEHAFNFTSVYRGLHDCAARRQLFLIDACRGHDLNDKPDQFSRGRTPLKAAEVSLDCQQMILYATHEGDAAEADRDEPSLFAKGFLEAVEGGASIEEEGKWVVGSTSLHDAINSSLEGAVPPTAQRVYTGGASVRFPVHELNGPPLVDILVNCDPDEHREKNSLHYWLTPNFDDPIEDPLGTKAPQDEWRLSLRAGFYTFVAMQPQGRRSGVARKPLQPAIKTVTIKCQ
ncbi:caspase family protein [Burkholderia cepacia]|uniref:caspase family protein n=1 Tax=Burkholderia cepacia TaxID=292 RepID=UPI0009BEC11B|nr:caspase family protein [Burkholderia cepacia]